MLLSGLESKGITRRELRIVSPKLVSPKLRETTPFMNSEHIQRGYKGHNRAE